MDDSSPSPLVGKPHPAACYAGMVPLRDPLPLELHVPSPPHRPGDTVQPAPFAEQPGDLPRPDTLAPHDSLRPHATGLVRVLDDQSVASGEWNPQLTTQQLRHGLEMMLRVRHFDARMMAMHRQGRVSFHVTSRGEEACGGGLGDGLRPPRLAVSQLSPAGVVPGTRHAAGGHDVPEHRQPLRPYAGPADARALQLAGRKRRLDLQPRRHAVAAGGRRGDGLRLSRRAARGRRLERRRHRRPGRFPPRAELRLGLPAPLCAARRRQSVGDQHPPLARHRWLHVRPAGRGLWPAGATRRRQRFSRRVRRRSTGPSNGRAAAADRRSSSW